MSATRLTRGNLPDGTSYSPPWSAREDFYLAEAMISNADDELELGSSFHLPGLATTLAATKPECVDYIHGLIEYLSNHKCPRREPDEVLRRLAALRDAYGSTFACFRRFEHDARAVSYTHLTLPTKA